MKWLPFNIKNWLALFVVNHFSGTREKIMLVSNAPLPVPLVNSKLWRIMPSNQRKGNGKLVSLQKLLVKVVARALNKVNKFEIQLTTQMAVDTTAIAGKISYYLLLKKHELVEASLKSKFKSLSSANKVNSLRFNIRNFNASAKIPNEGKH